MANLATTKNILKNSVHLSTLKHNFLNTEEVFKEDMMDRKFTKYGNYSLLCRTKLDHEMDMFTIVRACISHNKGTIG